MNLTVKLKDLQRIVGLVSTVTPTRTTLPTLNAALMAYDDCVLTACASDLRSFARAHCEAVGEQSGAFGVRADLLQGWLTMCSTEDVEISTEKRAKFACGARETTLSMIVAEEFVVHPDVEGKSFAIPSVEFQEAISKVIHAAAEEKQGTPERVAVALDFNPLLSILALNGRGIAVVETLATGKGVHLVPTFLAQNIKKIIGDLNSELTVTLSENMIRVAAVDWCLSGPLLNGNYPPWRERLLFMFEKTLPKSVFKRTDLTESIRMCLPYGELGFARVHVKGENGSAVIEVAGQDETCSTIPMRGESIDVFFQGKDMLAALSSLSADDVTLEYRDEKGIGIVVHENNFTAAVMPLEK